MYKYITGFLIGMTLCISGLALGATNSFPDVSINDWFFTSVGYVSGAEVMTGYDNGNFGPSDNVNRAELATILTRIRAGEISKLETELYALRQKDTDALIGSSWETYKTEAKRFPVQGTQAGMVRYGDYLEVIASDGAYELLSSDRIGDTFFIKDPTVTEMCPDCEFVYGPFYDDVDRIVAEIQQ